MSHTQQRNWVQTVKERFPQFFSSVSVLEVGSANINGSARDFFDNCNYIGIDVLPYQGVDVVTIAHEYNPDKEFDTVFSVSSLEHDMYWAETLRKMLELTRTGGLLFFSCGSRWEEHGTRSHEPSNSLTTSIDGKWGDYYRNLDAYDIVDIFDLNKRFMNWQMGLDSEMDLYFWGIKI
jgi:SAM-dependent methyltransferase